jgi:hypothetical protein
MGIDRTVAADAWTEPRLGRLCEVAAAAISPGDCRLLGLISSAHREHSSLRRERLQAADYLNARVRLFLWRRTCCRVFTMPTPVTNFCTSVAIIIMLGWHSPSSISPTMYRVLSACSLYRDNLCKVGRCLVGSQHPLQLTRFCGEA